jgi:ribose 1,5-bisphosphokinase
LPERAGLFVAVVGPSGAGKDSLINAAARHFGNDPRFMFVRRVVTRVSDKAIEDHDTVSVSRFAELKESGAFALCWGAHGILYGIPASAKIFVEKGGIAIANCSREAIADMRNLFGRSAIIQVSADPSVLAERLVKRGREDIAKISARLERAVADIPDNALTHSVENNGALEQANARFIEILERIADDLR